jgi:hypothetical protein
MFAEFFLRSTVDLQHTVWGAVTLEDDIHRTTYAMFEEELRRPKPLFILEVVGDHWFTGVQGEPGRRFEIRAHGCHSYDAFMPAHASPN